MSYRSSGNVDQRVGIVEAEVVAVVDVPSVGMTGGAAAGSMMTVRVKAEVSPDWWLPRSAERPQGSRDTAGKVVPAGKVAVVRSSDFLRAPERAIELSTLIH
jgi:hypothetical protein